MAWDKDFKKSVTKAEAERLRLEKEDYHNSIAGRETVRQDRFGFKKQRLQKEARKKHEKHILEQLLRINSIYAKLYNDILHNLRDAENAIYDVQVQSAKQVGGAQEALDQMLDNASTTADGKPVFRSADGSVYTQDGTLLKSDTLDDINWHEDSSSWEEYRDKRNNLEEKQQYHNRMNAHADRLAVLRNEMEDKDDPPSEDRLHEIKDEIGSMLEEIKINNDVQAEFTIKKATPAVLPDLGL